LTDAQQRVIGEIRLDLARTTPMTRLVQGDVGSGKTAVAAAAMWAAVEHGAQSALLAPTQILAEQHHRGISRLLGATVAPRRRARECGAADRARHRPGARRGAGRAGRRQRSMSSSAPRR
jgi:ATP-dependent DNA helicase RecG